MKPTAPSPGTEPLTGALPPPEALKVRVVSGPDLGTELLLEQGTYRVGKESGVDLHLTDASVSRTHLLLEVLPHGVRVTDPGSTNGTFYQGQRFSVLELSPPAVVRLGRTELQVCPVQSELAELPPSTADHFGALRGSSLVMRQLYAVLERLAGGDADILLRGETGTGKEACARALHEASARAKGPFVVCDLAGVSPTLLESDLFGHTKGAFTGATSERAGVFEEADGGTLLLDEVGELPLELQTRLLGLLERRETKRVGSNTSRKVDVRIIAATHRDLPARVKSREMREDLFHRISVVTVPLPPLRDRREDIPVLVDAFLARAGKSAESLGPATLARLQSYDWPGNVRELRNVVERVMSLGEDTALGALHGQSPRGRAGPSGAKDALLPFKEAKTQLLETFERDYVAHLLASAQGNVTHAARTAGISRVHLQNLVKKHGL